MAIALLDHTAPTVDENLALDEALLLAAEAGESGEVLRFWEWPSPAVVLGAGGSVPIDVNETACAADRITIHRRASGGGTVLLGRGCLLFSLVLAYERAAELRDVNASYRWILGRVRDALRPIATLEAVGTSDLAWAGRKVSGNAQQRKTRFLLHHGTMLYQFDRSVAERYLNRPEREPTYRAGRTHEAFLANLPTDEGTIKRLLSSQFDPASGSPPVSATARVSELIATKYGTPEWVRRR